MDATTLSDEELVDEVTTWGARVARGEARHLQLIADPDAIAALCEKVTQESPVSATFLSC